MNWSWFSGLWILILRFTCSLFLQLFRAVMAFPLCLTNSWYTKGIKGTLDNMSKNSTSPSTLFIKRTALHSEGNLELTDEITQVHLCPIHKVICYSWSRKILKGWSTTVKRSHYSQEKNSVRKKDKVKIRIFQLKKYSKSLSRG